jgi:hypothetical protein
MLLNPDANLPQLVFGFGVALFLALVCLLKWKQRREVLRQERLERSLRAYVANQKQEAA